jgi:hypothetical protein
MRGDTHVPVGDGRVDDLLDEGAADGYQVGGQLIAFGFSLVPTEWRVVMD